jgi:hypothetical protein
MEIIRIIVYILWVATGTFCLSHGNRSLFKVDSMISLPVKRHCGRLGSFDASSRLYFTVYVLKYESVWSPSAGSTNSAASLQNETKWNKIETKWNKVETKQNWNEMKQNWNEMKQGWNETKLKWNEIETKLKKRKRIVTKCNKLNRIETKWNELETKLKRIGTK